MWNRKQQTEPAAQNPVHRNRRDDPEIIAYIRETYGEEFKVYSCGPNIAYIESATHGMDVRLPEHLRIKPVTVPLEQEVSR